MEATTYCPPEKLANQIDKILTACDNMQIALDIPRRGIRSYVGYETFNGKTWSPNVIFSDRRLLVREMPAINELDDFIADGGVERLVMRQFVEKIKETGPITLVTFADFDGFNYRDAFHRAKRVEAADASIMADAERLRLMAAISNFPVATREHTRDVVRDLENYVENGKGRDRVKNHVGLAHLVADVCEAFEDNIRDNRGEGPDGLYQQTFERLLAVDTRNVATV